MHFPLTEAVQPAGHATVAALHGISAIHVNDIGGDERRWQLLSRSPGEQAVYYWYWYGGCGSVAPSNSLSCHARATWNLLPPGLPRTTPNHKQATNDARTQETHVTSKLGANLVWPPPSILAYLSCQADAGLVQLP